MKRNLRLWSVAHHEAGHAVIAHHEGILLKEAVIVPKRNPDGHIILFGEGVFPEWIGSESQVEREVKVFMAGAISQRKYNPKGCRKAHSKGDNKWIECLLKKKFITKTSVQRKYKELFSYTKSLLERKEVWNAVEKVATALVNYQSLSGSKISEICSPLLGPFNEKDERAEIIKNQFQGEV